MSTPTEAGAGGARPSHYWYAAGDPKRRERATAVLEAMRAYRDAETAMRRRTQAAMAMGENELSTLRYLVRAEGEQRAVSPRDLAAHLGVTTASTTALVDRLVAAGHVSRVANPSDRRSVHIVATTAAHERVRATLGRMHARMFDAVAEMTSEECDTVVACLARLRAAVDGADPSI